MTSDPRTATTLTEAQEARFRVLERMRHERWCEWPKHLDCNCKAGRLMLALSEAEAAAPDPVASPPEALRLLNTAIQIIEAADHRASAADGPVGHVRDEMTDAEWRVMYEALTQARRYLAATEVGTP